MDGCSNDLTKEKWAVSQGISVIRVLQRDVWHDRNDWRGWLTRSIQAASDGNARAIVPDIKEYTDPEKKIEDKTEYTGPEITISRTQSKSVITLYKLTWNQELWYLDV